MATPPKKIKFESWKFPRKEEQARALIENMKKAGSPVVMVGGELSWLVYDELGIRARPMSKDNLLAEMEETTDYLVQRMEKALDPEGKEIKDRTGNPIKRLEVEIGDIPLRVINTAYGLRKNKLWFLKGVRTHPIINREGKMVMKSGLTWHDEDVNRHTIPEADLDINEGYDPPSLYFFAVPDRVKKAVEDLQDKAPGQEEVDRAKLYIDFFLDDFIFATKSAKASAVAFMLTMICRDIIKASIPMLEVRAPESQSGKSLLVKMILIAITGERKPRIFAPNFHNVEEFEKELFSILLQGRNYVFMDNVTFTIRSAFLDMGLTSSYAEKRLLGSNDIKTVYMGMPFALTANNPKMSEDIKNRVYLLDILKPPKGKKYLHENPEEEAFEMGPELVRALIILYLNWDKNHRRVRYGKRRIDGYIEWSGAIGGILEAAGIEGFLEDTEKQINEISPEKEQAADMARPWYERHGEAWVSVKDTFDFAVAAGYVKETDAYQSKLQHVAAKLGKMRMVKLPGGYHFERNPDQSRGSQWRVVKDDGNG